ncbi:MAG: FecR family protein [Parabacteroides sp.]
MQYEQEHPLEESIRFVARHYHEGKLQPDVAWRQFTLLHPTVRRSLRLTYLSRIAAVVFLLVGIGTYWRMYQQSPDWVTFTVPAGERQEITLPDQTTLSLAAGSTLRFDRKQFGHSKRQVELQGKAFFQVQRDTLHPFSVVAGTSQITVLGTEFQVWNRTSNDTEVQVLTGRVRFEAGNSQVLLTTGEAAEYSSSQQQISKHSLEENGNWLAWKTDELHFRNAPLAQVIEDLENCFQVSLQNRTPEREKVVKLNATFHHQPLEEILQIINQTLNVQLVIQEK